MRTTEAEDEVPAAGVSAAGRQAVCHLLAPPLERSGRETPVSVDSIPLEWDHTVDVGGSSSHEGDNEEDTTFFSALSGKCNITQSAVTSCHVISLCVLIGHWLLCGNCTIMAASREKSDMFGR